MKVVIDTNILVSGLLSPYGNPAEILRLLTLGKLTICLDARIMPKYFKVLNRPKFKLNKDTVSLLLKEIELTGEFTVGIPLKESLPDSDDNMFLEIALGSNADCIITGNLNHFQNKKKRCLNVQILSPADFLKYYKSNSI